VQESALNRPGIEFWFARAIGATLEALYFLIAAFRRLAEITKSFAANEMVGGGGGDRTICGVEDAPLLILGNAKAEKPQKRRTQVHAVYTK